MTLQVEVSEAGSRLPGLIEAAESGEEVVLARAGNPVVRLTPLHGRPARRSPGAWQGRVWMPEDFDETPEDIIDEWYSDLEQHG